MPDIQFRKEDQKEFEKLFEEWQRNIPRKPDQIGGTISGYTVGEGIIYPLEVEPYSDFHPVRWMQLDIRFVNYLQSLRRRPFMRINSLD